MTLPRESSGGAIPVARPAPTGSKPGPLHHIYPGHAEESGCGPPVGAVAYCGHVKHAPGAHRWITGPQPDSCVVCWEMATARWAA